MLLLRRGKCEEGRMKTLPMKTYQVSPVGHVIFLKGLIAAAFESSEPLYLRLNGRVSAIPT